MSVVCCSLPVARYLLSVACYLLPGLLLVTCSRCCLWFVACFQLSVVHCLLPVVCGLLVTCCLLFVACYLLSVVHCLLPVICLLLVACCSLLITCCLLFITDYLSVVHCSIACYLLSAVHCLLPGLLAAVWCSLLVMLPGHSSRNRKKYADFHSPAVLWDIIQMDTYHHSHISGTKGQK